MKKNTYTSAFTLLELTIVIVIIGILASLAVPQFIKAAEKARTVEAKRLLWVMRESQVRYYTENEKYALDEKKLDVDWTTPRYYTMTGANDAAGSTYVGRAARKAVDLPKEIKAYKIDIDKDGGFIYDVNYPF